MYPSHVVNADSLWSGQQSGDVTDDKKMRTISFVLNVHLFNINNVVRLTQIISMFIFVIMI